MFSLGLLMGLLLGLAVALVFHHYGVDITINVTIKQKEDGNAKTPI